jgi:hypothetical protein
MSQAIGCWRIASVAFGQDEDGRRLNLAFAVLIGTGSDVACCSPDAEVSGSAKDALPISTLVQQKRSISARQYATSANRGVTNLLELTYVERCPPRVNKGRPKGSLDKLPVSADRFNGDGFAVWKAGHGGNLLRENYRLLIQAIWRRKNLFLSFLLSRLRAWRGTILH